MQAWGHYWLLMFISEHIKLTVEHKGTELDDSEEGRYDAAALVKRWMRNNGVILLSLDSSW